MLVGKGMGEMLVGRGGERRYVSKRGEGKRRDVSKRGEGRGDMLAREGRGEERC